MSESDRPQCSVEGCQRVILARGVCGMHYQRAVAGDQSVPMRELAPRVNSGRGCSVDGCVKPARKRTWCHMHYRRWLQYGDVLHEKAAPPSECLRCGEQKVRSALGKLFCRVCANRGTKAWRDADPEGYLERHRASYRRNIATYRAYKRAYYNANCEDILSKTYQYQKEHPEVAQKSKRNWNRNNPERGASYAARRRALKLKAVCAHGPNCVPWDIYLRIKERPCFYCPAPAAHADHYVPLARGGFHCMENIVPACEPCNRSKGALMPDEWEARRIKE